MPDSIQNLRSIEIHGTHGYRLQLCLSQSLQSYRTPLGYHLQGQMEPLALIVEGPQGCCAYNMEGQLVSEEDISALTKACGAESSPPD